MEKSLKKLNDLLRQGLITPKTYADSLDALTQPLAGEQRERPVPAPVLFSNEE